MTDLISSLARGIGAPELFLLILGGIFFLFYSGFVQYRYFFHAIDILRGKFDNKDAPGQISAYEALSTALASTVGMGNIAGVATAIHMGGPGALFWMWVTAFVGMSTNFFTSALAVMYRGKDSEGNLQGGPMYVIREALGKKWMPLAMLFSVCTMFGCLPIFQANQLTQIIIDTGVNDESIRNASFLLFGFEVNIPKMIIGLVLTVISGIVIIGGITRIGSWAGKMVPLMIVVYFVSVILILILNAGRIPEYFMLILTDAFSASNYRGDPMLGGVLGGLIVTGVQRASFSNEAGIGTAPLALGASRSREPIREGLVSMMSPAIDTLVVCTLTALAILVTDAWKLDVKGVTMTMTAFNSALGPQGKYLLLVSAFFFAVTSLFSYSYYGNKAISFIAGVKYGRWYDYFYLSTIVIGAVVSMQFVTDIIDISYALMAFPTMLSGFALAPKVMKEARSYFERMKGNGTI